MEHQTTTPDTAALAGWLHSWVTAEGAINGFHNHSVWGTNPATFLDFTSGHTTFAGPAVGAWARARAARPDERGVALLRRLLRYQCSEVQPDGQYAH
ncbi:hypothetical protein ACFWJJ_24590, partial [Streptomyces rubrogriseus]